MVVPVRPLIRRGALAAVATVLVAAAPGAAAASPAGAPATTLAPGAAAATWSPDVDAARSFIRERPGRVTFRLTDPSTGRVWGDRGWVSVPSASLLKTLLLAAYLRSGSVRDRPLTSRDRALLSPMIRRSANGPADELVATLGADAIARTARAAGMATVRVVRPWGLTRTTARDQVALFAALPDLIPARHRAYAMGLLHTVVPSQRWGIGQVPLPGWTVAFKGGWGSGSGAVDHQTALLVRGEQRFVLAITTTGNGRHDRGKATLRGVALRLLRGLA